MPSAMYPELERRRNRGFLGSASEALSAQDRHDRRQLRYELDLNSWNLRIWAVAASGFLTDSYNLFASNVILASISFVYFPTDKWPATVINISTLLGSVIGQLSFGYFADRWGRTRLYGIELVLVIVSTIGVATSNTGTDDMSFLALFVWWRFVMGIGIGAEYPLSAVITSEWSSTSSRVTMLASVFLMQPVGQALAQIVGVLVLLGFENTYHIKELQCGLNDANADACRKAVDGIWRIVIGSGAVPAVLAIIFRFFLYDCGLYTLEVKNKPGTAFHDTQRIYGPRDVMPNGIPMHSPVANQVTPAPMPIQFSCEDMKNYLIRDKNWYYLLGTAATWFFLDISFYGFSLDNRGVLADMWATGYAPPPDVKSRNCWDASYFQNNSDFQLPAWANMTQLPAWQTDATQPCNTIYDVLVEQTQQYLLTVSLASIAGSCCFIWAANRFPRRQWLTTSFLILSLLFPITGGIYYRVNHQDSSRTTVVLVAICHFVFNFGANTLTFIIPAEIFPTAYRCTCHGISAAAGKIGSILAVLVVFAVQSAYSSPTKQGLLFILFGPFMALGALFSWAYLPDIQRMVNGKREPRSLEDLGEGRAKAKREGEVITVKDKCGEMNRRRGRRRSEAEV